MTYYNTNKEKLQRTSKFLLLLSLMIFSTITYFSILDCYYYLSRKSGYETSKRKYYKDKFVSKEDVCESVFLIYKYTNNNYNNNKIQEEEEFLNQDFQEIANQPHTGDKLYMYSAYYDDDIKSVKLIGGSKMYSFFQLQSVQVHCTFYDHDQRLLSTLVGFIQNVDPIDDRLTYGASFIICPLEPIDCSIPTYVSINTAQNMDQILDVPKNLFRINYTSLNTTSTVEFGLCVQPTFSYDSPLEFLQWIEFYKLMGVGTFTFYNESIGPSTSCLMNQYSQDKDVKLQILKWSPVFIPDVEIHIHSQVIQINDCTYRTRGLAKYVVHVDFDEYILPSDNNVNNISNYQELLQEIYKDNDANANAKNISAFVFSNGFFFLNNNDTSVLQNYKAEIKSLLDSGNETGLEEFISQKLIISSKFERETLNDPYERSKYIVNPNLAIRAGVHYLMESKTGSRMYVVPSELAYVHHYRGGDANDKVMTTINNGSSTKPSVKRKARRSTNNKIIDKSAQKFVKQLAINVAKKLMEFGTICKIL